MNKQRKYKSIILTILLLVFFYTSGRSQPGYPSDGFVVYFKTDFIEFPDTLNSDNLRARYLDSTLTILFIDSTKSIENNPSLVTKCSYRVLSVDTNNVAELIIHIGSSYGLGECYDDELIIKNDSTKYLLQDQDFLYWYSGILIFINENKRKQFVCRNIPDGSWLDLQNIDFLKPEEFISIPSFHNRIKYEKDNITKFRKE